MFLIIKPSYYCPFGCKHCSVGQRNDDRSALSPEEVEVLVKRFFEVTKFLGITFDTIEIVWHGGEPMTMGPSFYERVNVLLQSSFPKVNFIHGIQTNLLLYDKSWKKVFSEVFNWRVGSSYDFFSSLRLYSEEKFINVLKKLQDDSGSSGFVITVLNKENINHVWDILHKSMEGRFYVKLNFLYPAGRALRSLCIDFSEYRKCIQKSIEFYEKTRYPVFPYFYFVKENGSFRCCFTNRCSDNIFYINPYGYLYKCAIWEDLGFPPYGHLLRDDILTIIRNYVKTKTLFLDIPEVCMQCELVTFCGGGCVAFRRFYFSGVSPLCEVTKLMYQNRCRN